ncbi:MAG TPA: heavy metal-binding domain-containing protein [Rectinemataceae bacterium]|nr:heavy metal-binding domain-containing protein [Rectinemataceae bacterium]
MANDLPPDAVERLNSMKGRDGHAAFFTSDLSVNEFLLVKEAGFEPVGMVVGSSIYHIGYQQSSWNKNQEMNVLTQAMYHARELAMSRMEEEADALGADGIIGVRLEIKMLEWAENLAEFVAIGTAVVAKDRATNWKTVTDKPFTSDLSGQDFWTLLRSGYRPLGFVMGVCVYHIAHQSFGQMLKSAGMNTEMVNFTQALYDSRELAMERMQAEATQLKAEGIVGVTIEEGSYGWSPHVIEFSALGTAVVAMRADHVIPTPQLVLTVDG